MRKYDRIAVQYLQNETDTVIEHGVEILVKKSPGEGRPGYLDPWEKACLDKNVIHTHDNPVDPLAEAIKNIPADELPYYLRRKTAEVAEAANYNLCETNIITKYEEKIFSGNKVGLWRYYRRDITFKKMRPCLINFHGGGFFLGDAYADENYCRLVAELTGAVVFNIEYSLAPEKPYPNAINEAYAVLCHIYEHAEEYGIDPAKIVVCGASAGSNIAAVLALRARDEDKPMIAMQILIVPFVLAASESPHGYAWQPDAFEMSEETKQYLGVPNDPRTDPYMDLMVSWYLEDNGKVTDPYVSPMMAKHFHNLPKTLIFTCEFDFLRHQGEYYGSLLAKAGVDTKIIRYKGCTHTSLGRLGIVPQAEDSCLEIAQAIKELYDKREVVM